MEFDRRSPVYEQVIQYFKEQIAAGNFSAGSEIPSRRELAAQFKINPNTAQRAYKEMEEQGLIYTEGNSPSRITEDNTTIGKLRIELIDSALNEFLSVAKQLGLSSEEISVLIHDRYEEVTKHD
ncbi:GntR family transcriptional regulator [Jeotgalibaca sp. PTS2502]|uniref:GntR family transcriptional regulator n=1 Tax=Jeotgalibaca sp. PTS2502 TaxID=1903686 RepID=UPI0018DEC140|nr:GntR family transcriptional regulator [Jeotgalibaca sp. PTS2502]